MSTHGNQEVTDEQILDQFHESDDPALIAPEVAEQLPLTRQRVHERLEELLDAGKVGTKKPSRDRMWWVTEDQS